MTLTLYHNPRCSKSREAKRILDDAGIAHDVVLYLENPPKKDALLKLARGIGSPRELLRSKEARAAGWRTDDDPDDPETIARFLAAHPTALQRPIVQRGARVIVARPAERVHELL